MIVAQKRFLAYFKNNLYARDYESLKIMIFFFCLAFTIKTFPAYSTILPCKSYCEP